MLSPFKKIADYINLSQVLGILIIGCGSLLGFYLNQLIGTIIIAVGTLILTFGGAIVSKKQNDRSSREFYSRIDMFENKLVAAQSLSDIQKNTEIRNIEDEFIDWAKNFTPKKQKIMLSYQKQKIAEDEYIITKSNEAMPYYTYLVETMKAILDAYSQSSSVKITYDFDMNIPERFYINYSNRLQTIDFPYRATVSFNTICQWCINIANHADFVEWKGGPQLNIELVKAREHKFLAGIVFDLKEKVIRVTTNDPYFSSELKETYMSDNYKDHIKTILRILVEYQLSMID